MRSNAGSFTFGVAPTSGSFERSAPALAVLYSVEAVAEPAPRRIAQILSRRFAYAVQRNQVLFRISREYLAPSEDVGFPAKASDAVQPAHEIRFIGCLDALQLFRRWPVFQESVELFLHILVNGPQASPGLRRCANYELAPDFVRIDAAVHRRRHLLVINEPLVKPRILPLRQHVAYEVQIIGVGLAVFRNIPDVEHARH